MNISTLKRLVFVTTYLLAASSQADVVSSSSSHYQLKHSAESSMPPAELWQRLANPQTWWHPDHTYSGDSNNLSLDTQAGGLWREDWQGNSVLHGSVLLAKENEMLRLDAPFGPLQEMGVSVVWTISLSPSESGGTLVVFDEIANGSDISKLDGLAPAVDFVKAEALRRLTENSASN